MIMHSKKISHILFSVQRQTNPQNTFMGWANDTFPTHFSLHFATHETATTNQLTEITYFTETELNMNPIPGNHGRMQVIYAGHIRIR